jgi:hypothetical protein
MHLQNIAKLTDQTFLLMSKKKILIFIPILIIAIVLILTWSDFLGGYYLPRMQHYAGLVLFLIVLILFFIDSKIALIGTGIFLMCASINLIAITTAISVFTINIFPLSFLPIQPLSLGILVIYLIVNGNLLIDIYLNYKESKGNKKKST